MNLMNVHVARLQPWYAALRAVIASPLLRWDPRRYSTVCGGVASVVWIASSHGDSVDDALSWERVCEALSLLALLVRVDFRAWKNEMAMIWPHEQINEWIHQELQSSPEAPFAIGLEIREPNDGDVTALRRIYNANAHLATHTSPECQELRAELEELLKHNKQSPAACFSHTSVPVRIDFSSAMLTDCDAAAILKQTYKLTKSQRVAPELLAWSTRRHRYAPSFTVVEIGTKSADYVTIFERGLQYLHQLTEKGVYVTSLQALYIQPAPRLCSASIQALRSLLALDDTTTPGIRSVLIADHYAAQVLPALLAAIQDSPAVETLRIRLGQYALADSDDDEDDQHGWVLNPARRGDHRHAWEKIAYHVFHPHATHHIHTLELHLADLQLTEVKAVRRMLAATHKNPLTTLYGQRDDATKTSEPRRRITASRFRLEDPDKPISSAAFVEGTRDLYYHSTKPVTVPVIASPSSDSTSWTVLLPGYGRAWIQDEDVLSVLFGGTSPYTPRELSKAFLRIEITSMSDESDDPVVDLLELIGHGTTHLTVLKCRTRYSMDEWCHQVLGVCPSLSRLELHRVPLESLQVFVAAAVAGRCHLHELLAKEVRTEDWRHIQVFLEALSDLRHPLATHLRAVDLRFIVENVNVSGVIEPLRQVLQLNRQLTTIHLTFQLCEPFRAIQGELELAFAQEVEERVWIRSALLDIRCKLALLSVLNSEETRPEISACGRLDTSVIALVFQFAAQGHARRFRLAFETGESIADAED